MRFLEPGRALRSLTPAHRLVLGIVGVAFVAMFFADAAGSKPSGDGYYSWIFARSLAFDFDLHFGNDYAICGDPSFIGVDRGGGRPDDPFYIGPAVFWAPLLFVLRLVFSGQTGCSGVLARLTLLLSPLLGTVTASWSFRAARRVVREEIAAAAAIAFALGTPLFAYATTIPSYSHVYSAFCVAGLLWFGLRAAESQRRREWLVVGAFVGLVILQRPNNAVYALVPAACALAALDRATWRAAVIPRIVVPALCLGGGAALGVGWTAWQYVLFYGTPFALPHGPYLVHLDRAHPWLLLFGVHGGFFFWAPVAWFAVVGLVLGLRRRDLRLLALGSLVAAFFEVWISSSVLDWDASWTIGARRLVPLTALLAVFGAVGMEAIFDRVRRRVSARVALVATALLVLVLNNVNAVTSRGDTSYRQSDLYNGGATLAWRGLDALGDLAILPGELVFALLYHLPPSHYRSALDARFYRDHTTLETRDATLQLDDDHDAPLAAGFVRDDDGGQVVPEESSGAVGKVTFSSFWPFATAMVVRVQSDRPTTLVIRRTSWPRDRDVARLSIEAHAEPRDYRVGLGRDTFDSGLLQYRFTLEGDGAAGAHVTLRSLTLLDEVSRQPVIPPRSPSALPPPDRSRSSR